MKWQELHSYWFGDLSGTASYIEERGRLWFYKDSATDEYIRKHFAPWLGQIDTPDIQSWKNLGGQAFVSLILLLDQVPRNSFRNSPQSFAYDSKALPLCLSGLGEKMDASLSPFEKLFFYLPLQHSENLEMQEKSVELYKRMAQENKSPDLKGFMDECFDFALKHYEIIKKFGRFPHRNKILGRNSTAEEIEFLKQPGSSF